MLSANPVPINNLAELEKHIYIVKAPFNFAILNIDAAGRVMDEQNLEQAWIGGPSLGGITACRLVADNPERAYGLFLFGTYCDRGLNDFTGPVVLLMGLEDEIIEWESYEQAEANLPGDTYMREVEGLNHSGFGNY
ncbi:MAG: alpha/beta hydrolase [Bacillota bacterium]